MKQRPVQDVSDLPTTGFGPISPIWWGTLAFIALESMGFALAAGAYLYLRQVNPHWPIAAPPPNHWAGTALLILLLVSIVPNALAEKAAKQQKLVPVQLWLIVMTVLGTVAVAIRGWEFTQLDIRWDDNAYGSITWFVLGLHAFHLLTDLGDTAVLTVLMFTRHVTKRRFGDVSDNAFYWYFVVASWIPLYALLYGVPRL
jgi:cytochrome c oxidase subunit III